MLKCVDSTQYGFKPLSSTTCALLDICEFVSKQLDLCAVKTVALVQYDFSNAFDQIDHSLLITKMLNCIHLNSQLCAWISSYLSGRQQRVRINSSYSNTINVTSGVPQGSLLGPLLFTLFVSDLTCINSKIAHMVKYADDSTLLFVIKSECDLQLLQNEMCRKTTWAQTNRMEINPCKSNLLFFTKRNTSSCILPSELFSIKAVSTLKILGVTFDQKLNFNEHFKEVLKCASRRLYFLRVLKNIMSIKELWMVFNGVIRSILEYAAPLFISLPRSVCKIIETIQKRAHEIICDNTEACNCVVVSLATRRIDLALRLHDQIYKSTHHPLSQHKLSFSRTQRLQIPILNRNLRRNSFFVKCAILKNHTVII